jgi:hypothetical protein
MSLRSSRVLRLLVLAGAVVAGCGGSSSESDDDTSTPSDSAPLLPWKAGNRWTYRVTEDGEVSEKVTTVGELEPVGGTGPFREMFTNKVTTAKSSGAKTFSWQAVSGTRLIRYREQSLRADGTLKDEQSWNPPRLHVDSSLEHTREGASWLEISEETELTGTASNTSSLRERWTVVSAEESITVPAGTFKAVVLTKAGGDTPKTYWFAPGVGKVKETGGQTEELTSYELMP